MTAGQHQAAAQAEEQAAAQHQAQYDPSQTKAAGPSVPSTGAYAGCIEYESSNCYVRWAKSTGSISSRRKSYWKTNRTRANT